MKIRIALKIVFGGTTRIKHMYVRKSRHKFATVKMAFHRRFRNSKNWNRKQRRTGHGNLPS